MRGNKYSKKVKKIIFTKTNMNFLKNYLYKILSKFPIIKSILWLESAVKLLDGKVNDLVYRSDITKIEDLKEQLRKSEKNFLPINNNINLLYEKVLVPENHKTQIFTFEMTQLEFFNLIKKHILKTDILLDIGAGVRPQCYFEPKVHICIEPFKEYRDIIKPLFPNNSYPIFIRTDALTALKTFDDNSVDSIFMLDLIEHLEKTEGKKLIKEADRVARKQIVIFTPYGFYPQHYSDLNDKDGWGLTGTELQTHKSGWKPKDFGQSWDFYICKKFWEAFLPKEKAKGKKYDAMYAIKTKNFKGFPIQDNTPEFVKALYLNKKSLI